MEIWELVLEITRRCNLKCEHCFRGDARCDDISYESITNTLKDIKRIEKLVISGGEPFLAADRIFYIIDELKKDKVEIGDIVLITNGTILNDDVIKVIKELKELYDLKLLISFDIFHREELKRLNLLDIRNKNASILKEMFQAIDYRNKVRTSIIAPIGRAKNLTLERLSMLNESSPDKHEIDMGKFDLFMNDTLACSLSKETWSTVCVDVYGNVRNKTYASYDDIDSGKCVLANVNELGLQGALECVYENANNNSRQKTRAF